MNNGTILGIDPGNARCGWGLIETAGRDIRMIECGCIDLPKSNSRLSLLKKELDAIIKKYKPSEAAIEKIFFFKNKKTIIEVSQARGVILLSFEENNLPCGEYTPLQIKQTTTGYGKADKQQIIKMMKIILNMSDKKYLDDTYDALAVAYTHACFRRINI